MEPEYLRQIQLRVLAGLLRLDSDSTLLAEFHKNVFPETFVEPLYSEICRAAKDLYSRTGDCDPIVLLSEISTKTAQFRHGDVEGAVSILFELTRANSLDSVSLSTYLPILQQAAMAKYLPLAQKDLEKDLQQGISYDEAYNRRIKPVVERYKYQAHTRYDVDSEVEVVKQKVEGFKRSEIKLEQVVPTGFPSVDYAMRGGMRPSQLIIVGARPATGKTTMALNVTTNVLEKTNKHVVFVSLEQTADQLVEKIVSIKAGHQFPKTKTELERAAAAGAIKLIEEATNSFPFSRLHVVEKTENIETLCTTIKELCQKHDVAAVVIDYLQLIPAFGERSRYEGITKISNKLKVLAKDADIPVVCLAQLSRNSDNENRTPRMADLRDSGSIEQDADIGILLYNDPSTTEEEQALSGRRTVNFDIQKNRNGALRNVKLLFMPDKSTFRELNQHNFQPNK